MDTPYIYTSLTRISNLSQVPFALQFLDREKWETADYIAAKIIDAGSNTLSIELPNGRMRGVIGGELIIGALGERYATLEATGTWKEVKDDLQMHVLTAAGLLGKMTSKSAFIPSLMKIEYKGHIMRQGKKVTMSDYIPQVADIAFAAPVIIFVGTSMSAGKTTSARIVTNLLKAAGLKVVGAKLAGAGRYKDILAIKDVGADAVFDFVDVGLPSSICEPKKYKERLQRLLSLIQQQHADIVVVEVGASPLEPYNGSIAINMIKEHIKCTILSASDPYAVLGLMKAFDFVPDIVTGIATNTLAGSAMVEQLCNVKALNLIDPGTTGELKDILASATGLSL
ncbi:hypothetical protein [Ascidiimonas aurantiaca]|uniref:hypothetical protein n=1 Tax=Ascidiimonas aurantiaca TaxID=1685432 RepID=UPI0030EF1EA4